MTHEYTVQIIEKYPNKLDERHREALKDLATELASVALEQPGTRSVVSLSTGLGKTSSIIGFAKAIDVLDLDLSLMVAAEKVKGLCDLKRNLVCDGVPEESIGLYHSYAGPVWMPPDKLGDLGNRKIVLCTQNWLKKSWNEIAPDLLYQGRERDLVIWDESFIASKAKGIQKAKLLS